MAVVTERTKNCSSPCSSATTKMPSGALTLNAGRLGYNFYGHPLRADHVLFEVLVPIMVLEGKEFITTRVPFLLLLLGAMVAASDPHCITHLLKWCRCY